MKAIKGRLLYVLGDKGLVFRNQAFYIVELGSGDSEMVARLPIKGIKSLFGFWPLANRMLRLEPRCAGHLDEQRFVVSVMSHLWLVDIERKSLMSLSHTREGYGLLWFCECDEGLYWGDYGANPKHEEINIYHLDKDLELSIVYTFHGGSIRHIHSILKDGNGFVVMAGDNEPVAGIYKVNSDWTSVKPWKTGSQKYRAVVGFPHKGGLLYATDSVETENFLRFISADGTESILASINGSCIYGGEVRDYFLFSTTVEPHEGGGIRNLLSYELGGGIKSREVHIVAVRKVDLSVRVIRKYRKDIWPMKVFQYGRVQFAGGQENALGGVWCRPLACTGTKGKSEYLELDE